MAKDALIAELQGNLKEKEMENDVSVFNAKN